MKLYKLTDKNDQTKNQTQWGKNVTHKTNGEGDLCGPGWLHAYESPLLAVLLNPIHALFDLNTAHLWEAEGEVEKNDRGLKCGTRILKTVRRIKIPKVSANQRAAFAILVAKSVYCNHEFNLWADNWLSGKNRSNKAAKAAWAAADAAAWAAADAAAWAAAWAADTGSSLDLIALAKQAMEYK